MAARHVVVVDPYSSGNLFAAALREHGFVPVAVTTTATPPEIYVSSYRVDDFDLAPMCADDPALVDRLKALAPVAVIPGAETGVELADRLAAVLTPSLSNDPRLTSARRHKGDMVHAVAAAGMSTIRTTCGGDMGEIASWLEREQLADREIVLKPPRSGGGNGFTLVPAGHDWRPAFQRLIDTPDQYGNVDREVVVQEYVTGTEYAVDTVTWEGRHSVSAICRYGKVRNPAHAAVYESIEFLPFDLPGHTEIRRYVEEVLDALGVRFGAAHTEVMVTPDGIRLVESGLRVAGGGLPEICRLCTGESPVDRLVRAVAGDRLRADFDLGMPAIVAFLVARTDGVAVNAEVFDEVRALPSFVNAQIGVRNGDQVSSTADLITTLRSGWVVLGHRDRLRLYDDYQTFRDIQGRFEIAAVTDAAGALG